MRKRLLRSRSGFEKPESREEAIMQNILGASNVLEPSESNIEEILKSILYNTPYTKEAEFEIEKILLAIKNNGTYDGEVESRDMKILLAILRESNYTEETESRIEELYVEWLQQRSQIKVLEGIPPLTFTSRGLPLINYLIEGNTVQNGGVGERTGNLFDKSKRTDKSRVVYTTGEIGALFGVFVSDFTPIEPNTTYTLNIVSSISGKTGHLFALYDENKNFVNTGAHEATPATVYTFTTPFNVAYIRFNGNMASADEIMLNTGSTALPYEPYGYKIPITCGGVTTDIYIGDSPLYDGDTISMTDTGIEIPTAYGNNVLTVDTTVQPSNVYIEYK